MNVPKNLLLVVLICLTMLLVSDASLGQPDLPPAPAANPQDTQWLTLKLKPNKQSNGSPKSKRADVDGFEKMLLKTMRLATSDPQQPQAAQKQAVDDLRNQWHQLNWDLQDSPANHFWVISESIGHRNGRGTYVLATAPQSAIVLQAPHRFSDLLTGSIAIKLFCEHSVSALALNTVHRNKIDLAHTKLHYLNAFTAAVLKSDNQAAIVQLHGFTKKGKTGAAKFTKVIVSDTTKFPGRSARQTALELKTTFGPDHTRLFPVEIRQLGGTTNRQSELAHAMGCPNFLHLEFNYQFRTELNKDASTRQAFYASIARGLNP